MADAADHTWALETGAIGPDFCLTFVRDRTPDEVIVQLGGAHLVQIVSAESAFGGYAAVHEWVDESGATRPSGLSYVAVTPSGNWTMTIEIGGCLSSYDLPAGELVSFFFSYEHGSSRFCWEIGGRKVVASPTPRPSG